MIRAIWNGRSAIAGLALGTLGLSAYVGTQAQEPEIDDSPLVLPGHRYDLPATLITAAQIQEHKQKMVAVNETDVAMSMVKMGGGDEGYQVGVSMVVRYEGQSNQYYAIHDDVAEVYYVIEGRGRMKLGGTITDWERRPVSIENGQGSRGTISEGAVDITIEAGDMLIIPAGTPHKWDYAEEFTAYMVVRTDPEGVAPLLELGMAEFIAPAQQY
jgi:mannose-6-phosphate isomerase-like protein (cupin superfamily)